MPSGADSKGDTIKEHLPTKKIESNSELINFAYLFTASRQNAYEAACTYTSNSIGTASDEMMRDVELVIDLSKKQAASKNQPPLLSRISRGAETSLHPNWSGTEFFDYALCLPLQVKLGMARATPRSADPEARYSGSSDLPGQIIPLQEAGAQLPNWQRQPVSSNALRSALACISAVERAPVPGVSDDSPSPPPKHAAAECGRDGAEDLQGPVPAQPQRPALPGDSKDGPWPHTPPRPPRGERRDFDDCALCLPVHARRAVESAAAAAAAAAAAVAATPASRAAAAAAAPSTVTGDATPA